MHGSVIAASGVMCRDQCLQAPALSPGGSLCCLSVCLLCCRRKLLVKAVAGSRWVPGLGSLAEFAFSMIEGMQSYYTYVEA